MSHDVDLPAPGYSPCHSYPCYLCTPGVAAAFTEVNIECMAICMCNAASHNMCFAVPALLMMHLRKTQQYIMSLQLQEPQSEGTPSPDYPLGMESIHLQSNNHDRYIPT